MGWREAWPEERDALDRMLCSVAIWKMLPLGEAFTRAASALQAGGALVFNVPSLYLGEADPPGGGRDPYLLELAERLSAGRQSHEGAAERVPPVKED